jgi:hypothetical protein
MAWVWQVATDSEEVHDLLRACDAYQASQSGTPAPVRRPETTAARVLAGNVHTLRHKGSLAAMFTLTWTAPFEEPGIYPPASRPGYLCRLAVRPDLLAGGSLLGARCVRKAVELATGGGADELRAEANPDLTQTRELLGHLGFEQCGPVYGDPGGARRVYLRKVLHR